MTVVAVSPPCGVNLSSAEGDDDSSKKEVARLASKIQRGTEPVTPADLERIRQIAFETSHDNTNAILPYLDRALWKHVAGGSSVLVRHVGMVQDMLDPEFYVTQVNGVCTKYRDHCGRPEEATDDDDGGDDNMRLAHDLDERQPLLVVPIPFAAPWLSPQTQQCEDADKASASYRTLDPMERHGTKRTHSQQAQDGMEVEDDMERISPKQPVGQPLSDTTKDEEGKTNPIDWWPIGCMGSNVNECPVLAKMYYEEDAERLRLNDVVELVGVLSTDPSEADFGHLNNDAGLDSMYDDEFHMVVPPPSQLPRLHVLAFRSLKDVDCIAACRIAADDSLGKALTFEDSEVMNVTPTSTQEDTDSSDEDTDQQGNNKEEEIMEMDDRSMTIHALNKYVFDGKNGVAAEALLLGLLSMGEREVNCPTTHLVPALVKTPFDTTLGCASWNFVVPHAHGCQVLTQRLTHVVSQIMPLVASTELSTCLLPGAPAKMGGRLTPSLLQLPKGGTLIINEAPLKEGTIDAAGQQTLSALSTMTRTNMVPYRFNGGDYPFEADYNILVLSSKSSSSSSQPLESSGNNRSFKTENKLLPCSLQVHVADAMMESTRMEESDSALPPKVANRIRCYLTRCRVAPSNNCSTNNIGLEEALLQQAQSDFIQRRQSSRTSRNIVPDVDSRTTIRSEESKEIKETDFHRWLTLTRLQARSRLGLLCANATTPNKRLATCDDWNAALSLDDSIQRHL
eukprot:scaffold3904_cov47-Attheya_sp.AAC.2